jgi:hypothetical protein
MAVERLDLDNNPGARAVHTFGRQGGPIGVEYDSEGNATFLGSLSVVGAISAGSGLGGASNPYGLAAETVNPFSMSTSYNVASGTMVLCLMALSTPITHLGTWLRQEGVTSSGSNRLVIYASDGTLIDTTTDMTADFATSTIRCIEAPLASGSYDPGGTVSVYIGALTHFSGTVPQLEGTADVGGGFMPAINGLSPTIYLTGQTSAPASINPATANKNSASYYFYAR